MMIAGLQYTLASCHNSGLIIIPTFWAIAVSSIAYWLPSPIVLYNELFLLPWLPNSKGFYCVSLQLIHNV